MEAAELRTWNDLLDLEGFEVVQASSDRSAKLRRLTVVPVEAAGVCPHCARATAERHVCYDREVIDLPLGGWKTQLIVRLSQFRCERCNKFFTPPHASLAPGAHATERFLERLADLASHSDLSAAARFAGVAEKTAERWYYDYLERRAAQAAASTGSGQARDLKPIRSLGIDELSLKKDTGNSAAS